MNVKAMAAIALTIIVAAPIGLGYMLNINDIEKQIFTDTDETNISNLINNSTQDVYTNYTGLENNHYVYNDPYQEELDFVTTGSTVTSIPVYSSSSYSWSVATNGAQDLPAGIGNTWRLSSDNSHVAGFGYTDINGVGHVYPNVETIPDPDPVVIQRTLGSYVVVDDDDIWDIPIDQVAPSSFQIYIRNAPTVLTFEKLTITSYAYQSAGWHAPGTPGTMQPGNHMWYNKQVNDSLLMTIDLKETSKTWLHPNGQLSAIQGYNAIYIEKKAAGDVLIKTYGNYGALMDSWNLGKYEYIQLLIEHYKVTAYCLQKWPALGEIAQSFNTVELAASFNYNYDGGIKYIGFSEDVINTGANIFRVDTAQIKAATYPVVNNATITPKDIKPDLANSKITISKVGIYGSSIDFGGNSYTVSNGRISVSGHNVDVDGASFKSITEDGVTWQNYINNYKISETAAISDLDLNGTWSAIYTLYKLDAETKTVSEWIPGGFGIDFSTMAVIGLIVCAAVTIGLGIYGKRSGTKMMWLMLISGGAALVFFFMI